VLAGGSNLVLPDDGWPGVVVHVQTGGVAGADGVLEVQAGESWDDLVAVTVADGLAGFECLSGIPGSVGATPIQNVGAYGQEVAESVRSVRVLDRSTGAVSELAPAGCGFGYRTSAFRRSDRWVVLAVTFALRRGSASQPLRYAELARALEVEAGATAPLDEVRAAVLALRRGKGMVTDAADPDTVSAGSFFMNPLLAGRSGRVLEVGAGNGMNFGHYPATVTEVLALEPEPYLRERAQAAARDAPVPVTVREGVAHPLPAEDDEFDAAVASLVLCSVPDPDQAVAELRRVVRPGGELRFLEHVRSSRPRKAHVQQALDRTGVWPLVGGGCRCARDTPPTLQRNGFA